MPSEPAFTICIDQDEVMRAVARELAEHIVAELEGTFPAAERGAARAVIARALRGAASALDPE